MNDSIFTQLSLIIAVVAVVSLIMRLLRQPLIMGYIITGVIVGPVGFNIVQSHDVFESFSSIGITLLLFIIGLGLNAGVIKSLGKVALTTSLSIMLPLTGLGFGVSRMLGFSLTTSVILATALFFSSTIIILKVLSDSKELSRLYGQIAMGVLLIEDVIASIALVVVASINQGTSSNPTAVAVSILILKVAAVGGGLYIAGRFVLPYVSKWFARSQESLFLFTIGWGLVIATLFDHMGLSHEVGALFAGVSLAGLPYATEMAARLKPLRDFFIVIFFVNLGEAFTIANIRENILVAHILAAIIVFGKPLLVLTSLGLQGYTRLTNFKTAIHLSQLSEFSIILVTLAASRGLIGQNTVALVALVAFISIGVSTYLMKYDDQIFAWLEKPLRHFERVTTKEHAQRHPLYPIILVGYHKGGHEYLKTFREMKERYIVVDYDPEIIDHLEEQGVRHAYGDATDEEFLDEISAGRAKLVVSTMTDVATNQILLSYLRRHSQELSFICHANNYKEASDLYAGGASYVSLPHYIGSERISSFIKRHGLDHEALKNYRDKHLITIGRQALKS